MEEGFRFWIRDAEEQWCLHHALTPAPAQAVTQACWGDWRVREGQEDIAEEVAKELVTGGSKLWVIS